MKTDVAALQDALKALILLANGCPVFNNQAASEYCQLVEELLRIDESETVRMLSSVQLRVLLRE
jgi:hypothetical protein